MPDRLLPRQHIQADFGYKGHIVPAVATGTRRRLEGRGSGPCAGDQGCLLRHGSPHAVLRAVQRREDAVDLARARQGSRIRDQTLSVMQGLVIVRVHRR